MGAFRAIVAVVIFIAALFLANFAARVIDPLTSLFLLATATAMALYSLAVAFGK